MRFLGVCKPLREMLHYRVPRGRQQDKTMAKRVRDQADERDSGGGLYQSPRVDENSGRRNPVEE